MPADLDDLLRRADTVRPDELPVLPAKLLDEIVAGRRRRPRRRHQHPLAWSGGLALAMVAAVAAALVLSPQRPLPPAAPPGTPAAEPAAFLRGLATLAAGEPGHGAVESTWRAWIPTRPYGDGPLLGVDVAEVTTTQAPDGSGGGELPYGAKVEFYSPAARAAWESAGRPRMKPWLLTEETRPTGLRQGATIDATTDLTFRPEGLAIGGWPSPARSAGVRDAADLRRLLAGQLGQGGRIQWFHLVRLLTPGYRPRVRAAAYELLAELPGISLQPSAFSRRPAIRSAGREPPWSSTGATACATASWWTPARRGCWATSSSCSVRCPGPAPAGTRICAIALLSARGRR